MTAMREFELVPPGKIALLFPLFIGLVLPVLILGTMVFAAKGSQEWHRAGVALLAFPIIAGFLGWSMHGRKIRVSADGLSRSRLPWPRPVRLAELDLAQARVLDLDAHPELRPVLKIAGTRIPGFSSGLFWLRDRRRASVLLTDRRRVLVLPRRDGNLVMLSPERPEALLEALRAASTDSASLPG